MATAVFATVLKVVGHLFATPETCLAKCVNMLPQERMATSIMKCMLQENEEDMEALAAEDCV